MGGSKRVTYRRLGPVQFQDSGGFLVITVNTIIIVIIIAISILILYFVIVCICPIFQMVRMVLILITAFIKLARMFIEGETRESRTDACSLCSFKAPVVFPSLLLKHII